MIEYKLIVFGNGDVGKTALTVQFVQGSFLEHYDPTIEDSYRTKLEIDGESIMLRIIDTAGLEQFTAMRDLYMKNGNGFVLVYSITSQSSFDDIQGVRDQIIAIKGTVKVPMILVGNKCDLEDERAVGRDEGLNLATIYQCAFMETSAKERANANAVFRELVRLIKLTTPETKEKTRQRKRCVLL